MRVTGIRIRSFGALRDVDIKPTPGLNVFHGPNESGKTTVMEFMRRSMVPTKERKVYPAFDKTDSGVLSLEEDGIAYSLELKGRSATGTYPPTLDGMSVPVFKGLFAMNPDDLDDPTALKSEEVRGLMVGVPGGDVIPEAMHKSESRLESIIGKSDRSKSELNEVEARISELDRRISDMRSEAGRYGELAERKSAILETKRVESEGRMAEDRNRRIVEAYQNNAGNYARLSEVDRRLSQLGPSLTEEDVEIHDLILSDVRKAEAVMEKSRRALEEAEASLEGMSADSILRRSDDVEILLRGQTAYERDLRSQKPSGVGGLIPIVVAFAGVAVIATGVAMDNLAISAVGAVATVAGLVMHLFRRRSAVPVTGSSDYENLYRKTASSMGITVEGMEAGLTKMRGLCQSAERYREAERQYETDRSEYNEADASLSRFLSRFNGEEGWERAVAETGERTELESTRSVLREAIQGSGLDPDVPECTVTYRQGGDDDELDRELGAIEERMRSILDDDELNSLMDSRASAESQREDILVRGAVAVLAGELGRMACENAASSVKPAVMQRADGYLSRMTDGRYSIHPDSVSGEVSVLSDGERKELSKCSSGLRSQVMLSLKLAMAGETGHTGVPLILDDVLLNFDSRRKGAACRLLSEISGEIQVLYFTCDSETYNLFSETGNCNGIPMGSGLNRY